MNKEQIITSIEGLEGKTIKKAVKVYYDNSLCLAFTDNTYAVLMADYDGEDAQIELDTQISNIGKHKAGLITETEFKVLERKTLQAARERVQELEIKQLKKLQKKYNF